MPISRINPAGPQALEFKRPPSPAATCNSPKELKKTNLSYLIHRHTRVEFTTLNRRSFIKNGILTGTALGSGILTPGLLLAQAAETDVYNQRQPMSVHPVSHASLVASLVLNTPNAVIYVDPVGGAKKHTTLPPADLIMVTHEHGIT